MQPYPTIRPRPPAPPRWLTERMRQVRRGLPRGAEAASARETAGLLAHLGLSTVCVTARCPNRLECFSQHLATFLILGEVCTRGCAFCAIKQGRPPLPPDDREPEAVAEAVAALQLAHVVITSVSRDDLADGGAKHFAAVVRALRQNCPATTVELLVPDFGGSVASLEQVIAGEPNVVAHNIETVPRLYDRVRRGADYRRSLDLLRRVKRAGAPVAAKSGIMLGLGEREEEVESVLHELAATGCDMLTLGQYLPPSPRHAPVARYVEPEEFARWRASALALGLKSVAAGPLVRSSYLASVFYQEVA
ncbi:MAG: lipoyl synthase [Pseudomonadota bacterium]